MAVTFFFFSFFFVKDSLPTFQSRLQRLPMHITPVF